MRGLRRPRIGRRLQLTAEGSPLEPRHLLSSVVVGHHSPIAARIHVKAPTAGAVPFDDQNPPFPYMPTVGLQNTPGDVMYQDTQAHKTFEIFNNTDQTVYPILEGEQKTYPTYDDQDPPGEYRVYVGFDGPNGYEFGLPAMSKIAVTVPMAIWDGGRLLITLGTGVTTQDFLQKTGPFYYDSSAKQYVEPIGNVTPIGKTGGTTAPGGVLLYHADPTLGQEAAGIGNDAPAQLIEFSIRDPSIPGLNPKGHKWEKEIDYDISYVDGMYLPAALEADGGTGGQRGYVGTLLPLNNDEDGQGENGHRLLRAGEELCEPTRPLRRFERPPRPVLAAVLSFADEYPGQPERADQAAGRSEYFQGEPRQWLVRHQPRHLDIRPGNRRFPGHQRRLRGQRAHQTLVLVVELLRDRRPPDDQEPGSRRSSRPLN